jgi:phenylacetate-CoA ligase
MYWEKDIETMPRPELEVLQLSRLKETLKRAKASYFYGRRFREESFNPDTFDSLKNIEDIPLTTKDNLREHWPYGFLSVSRDELVRMHSSSGTTGRATVIFHTAGDVKEWANLVARCMYMTGVRKSDVFHIIPSYSLHLFLVFEEMKVDPRKDTKLKIAFVGAEPHSEQTRRKIEELYGFKAYNSYGLSEMNGPGVAFECPCQNGLHIWEDNFFVEIIDPETLKPLPDGEEGELVLTTLRREGMPILRYRTKDLTRIVPGRCECGRTHRRIERIKGRTDDMMIIKGVNIFPIQIEKKLMDIPGVGTNFLIVLERQGYNDFMTVKVEVQKEFFDGDVLHLERLQKKIVEELKSDILITPKVELVGPNTLPKSEGKAQRVMDNRKD